VRSVLGIAFRASIMNPQNAVDLGREAVNIALLLGAPVLVSGMIVGLAVGLLQAITQIQEQTVSFLPKLVAMVLVLSLTLPWLIQQMVQYSHDLIVNIPNTL
jgi:flagellar biosynthetic protein FliQ